MTAHPHVAGLFALADPDWRRKIFRGGLVLLVPVLGWPAVLGYRKALVRHLFHDTSTPLPPWKGQTYRYFVDGIKAMGVIFGYLAPLYVLLGVVVTGRGFVPDRTTAAIVLFFLLLPIFSTLSFPTACLLFTHAQWISARECVALGLAFAAILFLIPAGFLRVSQTGRHLSGFAVWHTFPFVIRHFRAYASAWWHSGIMSLAGHFAIPLSPWGVVWSYLAIIFLFNEILAHAGAAPGQGWMQRSLEDPRFAVQPRIGAVRIDDARGEPATVLVLGSFSAPLPRFLARRG